MKVVILAGGMGTRISEESHLKPKPMITIGDSPILWHIMKYYSTFGFNDFVICCGYKGHMIKEYFSDYYLHRSDITYDFTEGENKVIHSNVAEPWRVTLVDTGLHTQTGGRIKRVRKYLEEEPFMLTYGDGVSNIDLHELLKQHRETENAVTISATQPGGRFGVLDIEGSNVVGFREKSKEDGGWINAGFMVMQPEIFDYLRDDDTILEREPLEQLSLKGLLGVYKHYGYWRCMDTQRDRMYLQESWEEGDAPWKIW